MPENVEVRQDGYHDLEQKAREILTDQSLPVDSHSSMDLVLQLLVEPTFYNHKSWTVFIEKESSSRIIRQVIWDRAFDGQRFFNPMEGLKYGWHVSPTIKTSLVSIDGTTFDPLLEEARTCAEWAEPPWRIVIDGLRCSLYMPGYFGNRVLKWNYKPEAGNELISWAEKMQDFLMDIFNTELE